MEIDGVEVIEESQLEGKSKLPWFIDVFLYPLDLSGVIHVLALWFLVFLLCPLIMATVGLGIEYIPIVYSLPIAYVLYYLTECIRDSAMGRCSAPDYWMHPTDSDKWDCIGQLFLVVGSVAVCFCPVSVYYIVTGRTDLIYWLLMACSGFFFPMVLLSVVLQDGVWGLNPFRIVVSILRTFPGYLFAVWVFWVPSGIACFIIFFFKHSNRLTHLGSRLAGVYLLMVASHVLGRFFYRQEERLRWF